MSLVSDGQKTQKHFHHENDGEKNMIMMMVMMVMLMGDGDDGSLGCCLAKEIMNMPALVRIEAGRRLIQDHNRIAL